MNARWAARLAWSIWVFDLVLHALSLPLQILNVPAVTAVQNSPGFMALFVFLFLAISTVGALIASRRPQNPIGWLFCLLGALLAVSNFTEQYGRYALLARPGALPGGAAMAWVSTWLGGPSIFSLVGFLILYFPNGRLPSARWRLVVWAGLAALGLAFLWALKPGPLDIELFPGIANPYGIEGGAEILDFASLLCFVLSLVTVAAAALSLVLRFRKAVGEERQQIKWVAFAGAIFVAVIAVGPLIWFQPESSVPPWLWIGLFTLGMSGIPISFGIAILRYRLYDIDLIIRRTLVYAALTAVLALIYFGTVALLQNIFTAVIGQQSAVVIVISTLTIAALFAPLRRRIQSIIDRRFYRRKYDAARTLSDFGAAARDETDLEQLSARLLGVVRETIQPAEASLWLRPETDRRPRPADR